MWDSLAAAYLLDPGFVTKTETMYLDVLSAWGRFYGSTVPLDANGRRAVPDATAVTVATQLDFKRVFDLYKQKLTK
jgi:inosine-uridine nucleoside N-ribohydrolase